MPVCGRTILRALTAISDGDYEGALMHVCAAVEKTAELEYGAGGKQNYKRFVKENLPLITKAAFGGPCFINVTFKLDPAIRTDVKLAAPGHWSLEDVIYHLLRCGLYHQGEISSHVRFVKHEPGEDAEVAIGAENGVILLNPAFVTGLVVAVIAAPVNKDVTDIPYPLHIDYRGQPLAFYPGDRDVTLQLMGILDAQQPPSTAQQPPSA